MRLIDAEDYLYRERPMGLSDELYEESHLYRSIMEQEVIQAISLDKVKKAREEMKECSYSLSSFSEDVFDEDERVVDLDDVLIILDKLIESEG